MEKKYLRTLTSLRFFACIMIVIYHMPENFMPVFRGKDKFALLGVTFFFILSGFTIRYIYGPFKNLKESYCFLWNRAVRIYPLHLITLLVYLLYTLYNKAGFCSQCSISSYQWFITAIILPADEDLFLF